MPPSSPPPKSQIHRLIDENIAMHEASISKLEASIAELKFKIIELKTYRNTHCAVSKLPAELLATIMSDDTRQSRSQDILLDSRSGASVAGVCRGWRVIAFNTPQLWGSIDVTSVHPNICLTMLRLSKLAPLHIRYELKNYDLDVIKRYDAAAKAIMEQVGRIQTLDITAKPEAMQRFLRRYANVTATSLQVLRLGSWDVGLVLNKDLLRRETPALHTLELHGGTIGLDIPLLPSLVHLSVYPNASNVQRTVPLLRFLETTPNIQSISLDARMSDLSVYSPGFGMIALPRLSRLNLTFPWTCGFKIFNHLPRPTWTRLSFPEPPGSFEHSDLTTLKGTFSHFAIGEAVSSVDARVGVTDAMHVAITINALGPNGVVVDHFELEFPLLGCNLVGILRQLSTLPLAEARSLTLTGLAVEGVQLEWRGLFQPFRGVKVLHFGRCGRAILGGLLRDNDTEYVPLPDLQEIHFHDLGYAGGRDEPVGDLRFSWLGLKRILDQRKSFGKTVEVYWDIP